MKVLSTFLYQISGGLAKVAKMLHIGVGNYRRYWRAHGTSPDLLIKCSPVHKVGGLENEIEQSDDHCSFPFVHIKLSFHHCLPLVLFWCHEAFGLRNSPVKNNLDYVEASL